MRQIWITWERQIRNESMAELLGAKLLEFSYYKNRFFRYFFLTIKTAIAIVKEKPNIVYVQNPSLVLALFSVLFKYIVGYRCVVDQHNSGIFPLEGRFTSLNYIARFVLKHSDFSIITNDGLVDDVLRGGGRPIVIPDPLPGFKYDNISHRSSYIIDNKKLNILFICSWSEDEPFMEVLEAAKQLDSNRYHIWVTGKPKKQIFSQKLPDSITLLGFVTEPEYRFFLSSVDAVIVLTKRENCLNCGAYEAVSMEKPGILARKKALMDFFDSGFIFTELDHNSIKSSIEELGRRLSYLEVGVRELKLTLLEAKNKYKDKVLSSILKGIDD